MSRCWGAQILRKPRSNPQPKSLAAHLDYGALRGAKNLERVLQIGRVRALELDILPRRRMREAQSVRVQPLALEAELGADGRICAVHRVADARVALSGHVHANLVRSSSLKVHLEQRGIRKRLERLVVRDRWLAVRGYRELPARRGVASDRGIDCSRERVWVALHDGVVDLGHLAVVERAFERRVPVL